MGSFSGHVLPGSLLLFIAISWTLKVPYRFFCKRTLQSSRSRCYSVKWDTIESSCKIFMALFGLVIEQVLPWEPHFHLTTSDTGEYTRANNWSHSTMYSFFLVSGIADFLVMKFPKISPHCIQHIFMALALATEGYLFFFHTHGRQELDVRLHLLLVIAIWPTSILFLLIAKVDFNENFAAGYPMDMNDYTEENSGRNILPMTDTISLLQDEEETSAMSSQNSRKKTGEDWMEMKFKRHFEQGSLKKEFFQRQKTIFTLQLATAATTILHGTWFWQIAYVLYPPNGKPWDQDSHSNIAFITMFFCWHALAAITFVGTVYFVFAILTRKNRAKQNARICYTPLETSQIP